jgi:hypothetical protein
MATLPDRVTMAHTTDLLDRRITCPNQTSRTSRRSATQSS